MDKQVITTNDVAIKQVEISVKVLKIGNRQVTQAVFKQLPEEPIINPLTGELQGEAWGRVNYHPDCSDNTPADHLHVVWQKGNELRRAVEAITTNKGYSQRLADVKVWSYQYVITRILEGSEEPDNITPQFPYGWDAIRNVDLYLVPFDETITVNLEYGDSLAWNKDYVRRQDVEKRRRVPSWDSEKVFDRLCLAVRSRDEYGNVLVRSYDQLKQLDQLFIAV